MAAIHHMFYYYGSGSVCAYTAPAPHPGYQTRATCGNIVALDFIVVCNTKNPCQYPITYKKIIMVPVNTFYAVYVYRRCKSMRRFKARLVYKGKGKTPCKVEIDDYVIVKRGEDGVVCQDEQREYALGVFDFSMSGGDGNTRIFWDNDKLYVQDMGSYNGTYIEYDGEAEPIKGWAKRRKGEPRSPSERVVIKKSRGIRAARTPFRIEIEPVQTVIEHHGSGDLNVMQVEGDYHDITIRDSVVQRSNIGTVSKGIDEEVFSRRMDEVEKRADERTERILEGQLELKGITKELRGRMEVRFNELRKELPYPVSIEKKRMTIRLEYQCANCDNHVGTIKDKRWKKWLMLGVAGTMVGAGIAVVGVGGLGAIPGRDAGAKGLKSLVREFTGKPLSDIPAEKFLLTREEKDKIRTELREQGIMDRLYFCPKCKKWVCSECFDEKEGMCLGDVQARDW